LCTGASPNSNKKIPNSRGLSIPNYYDDVCVPSSHQAVLVRLVLILYFLFEKILYNYNIVIMMMMMLCSLRNLLPSLFFLIKKRWIVMAKNIMRVVVVVVIMMMINNHNNRYVVSAYTCARSCADLRAQETACVPGYLCYIRTCSRILRCTRRSRSRSRSLLNNTAIAAKVGVVSNKTLVVDCMLLSCEIMGEAFEINNTDFTFVRFNFKVGNGDTLHLADGTNSTSVVSFEDCTFTTRNGSVIPLAESELTADGLNSTEPIPNAAEDYLLGWTM
jgi:hypothetical protein